MDGSGFRFMHEEYGDIFTYSAVWGNYIYISNSSNEELKAIGEAFYKEVHNNKDYYLSPKCLEGKDDGY